MRLFAIAGLLLAAAAAANAGFPMPPGVPSSPYVDELESRLATKEKLTQTKMDLDTGTDGGGEVIFYSNGGKPRKMVMSVGMSNRVEVRTYFYIDGSVVLLIENKRYFKYDSKKETLDPTKFSREEESRYYFYSGSIVCSITPIDGTAAHDSKSNTEEKITEKNKAAELNKVKITEITENYLKNMRPKRGGVDIKAFIKGLPR